jgi:hypothetical protein
MLQSCTQTTAGLFDFTTLHAAPERLEGGATSAATDVNELASTLSQLIVGHSAFRSYDGESPASVILRILRDPVQPVIAAGVPVALSDLLLRAMSKDKDHRPPTAPEFAGELSQIEGGQGCPRPGSWSGTQYPQWQAWRRTSPGCPTARPSRRPRRCRYRPRRQCWCRPRGCRWCRWCRQRSWPGRSHRNRRRRSRRGPCRPGRGRPCRPNPSRPLAEPSAEIPSRPPWHVSYPIPPTAMWRPRTRVPRSRGAAAPAGAHEALRRSLIATTARDAAGSARAAIVRP